MSPKKLSIEDIKPGQEWIKEKEDGESAGHKRSAEHELVTGARRFGVQAPLNAKGEVVWEGKPAVSETEKQQLTEQQVTALRDTLAELARLRKEGKSEDDSDILLLQSKLSQIRKSVEGRRNI